MRRALLLPLAALLLTGCIGGDLKEAVMKLSESDRSWCASVTTIYGTVKMGGSGLQQGKMICNGEGWQIDSQMNSSAASAPGVIMIPAAPRVFMQDAPGVMEIDPSIFRKVPK